MANKFNVKSRWIKAQMMSDYLNGMSEESITERYANDRYGFNHPDFAEIKRKTREQDDYILNPPDVEEGVVECKCGSKKVYSVSVQTRSADEPMSTRAFCYVCKARWTQNC